MCLCCRKIASNLDEMISFIASTIETLRDNQANIEQQFHSLSDECILFKQQTETMVGNCEKQLLRTLDDLGVMRQAYHGKVFVGNHCKIILNNFAKVCAVIANAAPEFYEKFKKMFELFAEAHKLMTRKKLPTDMEIQILKQHCYKSL